MPPELLKIQELEKQVERLELEKENIKKASAAAQRLIDVGVHETL